MFLLLLLLPEVVRGARCAVALLACASSVDDGSCPAPHSSRIVARNPARDPSCIAGHDVATHGVRLASFSPTRAPLISAFTSGQTAPRKTPTSSLSTRSCSSSRRRTRRASRGISVARFRSTRTSRMRAGSGRRTCASNARLVGFLSPLFPLTLSARAARSFNVVKAYSLYDEDVGYTQGLQFIVGPLLLNVRPSASLAAKSAADDLDRADAR